MYTFGAEGRFGAGYYTVSGWDAVVVIINGKNGVVVAYSRCLELAQRWYSSRSKLYALLVCYHQCESRRLTAGHSGLLKIRFCPGLYKLILQYCCCTTGSAVLPGVTRCQAFVRTDCFRYEYVVTKVTYELPVYTTRYLVPGTW